MRAGISIRFFLILFQTILCSYFNHAISQPAILWQNCRGGQGGEIAYSIVTTSDSGFVMCGQTNANSGEVSGFHSSFNGNDDGWIVKTDSVGNFQWQICLGDTMLEILYSVIQTADGGYLACGRTYSNSGMVTGNHGDSDGWLVKIDNSGNFVWQKCYGGTSSDYFKRIIATDNDHYLVCGATSSNDGDVTGNHSSNPNSFDAWALKVDNNGAILWQKCFGGSGDEIFNSVILNQNNQLAFCGATSSNDFDVSGNHADSTGAFNNDIWVAIADTAGNLLSQKCFGGSLAESATDIIQTTDSGYAMTGTSTSNDGDVSGNHISLSFDYLDAWTIKTDNALNLQFQNCFGGSYGDGGTSIIETIDGNLAITGSAESYDGDVTCNHNSSGSLTSDAFVVKYDNSGSLIWHKCLGGSGSEGGYALVYDYNDNLIMAGQAKSFDGDVVGLHGLEDFWIVALANDSLTGLNPDQGANSAFEVFPNPVNNHLQIVLNEKVVVAATHVKLTDISGKEILSQHLSMNRTSIDVAGIENGIYFLTVNNEQNTFTLKILIQH